MFASPGVGTSDLCRVALFSLYAAGSPPARPDDLNVELEVRERIPWTPQVQDGRLLVQAVVLRSSPIQISEIGKLFPRLSGNVYENKETKYMPN